MSVRLSILLFLYIISATNAIECYMGFKLIAGQQVGEQTIKCDNPGAQCYNATVAEGGGVIDLMKMGCSMWRCMAARDSCISTSIKNIPMKFCCCGTHLCNIDRNSGSLANQRVGGWNAEKPQDGEEGAVMRVLGSDNAERPHYNMTEEEMRSVLEGMNVDEDVDGESSTTVAPSPAEPSLGAEVELEN
ncbi:hypothetical protein PENTCL1PPCAC_21089 [Pristionchus entomophagus]|uniref:Activin types I and II receptor domain-containing protein n=1 Tax=Pristionchus entomophagus TaxID=358040 RepID=A0AAV5TXE5_9BILA|nr:hypothetical protein PENTCL1PPCAC_21089 [Pristionchus entomophagus]